jgi:hypothetical protein
MRPLAIDLCCGLGGWTDGLMAEGYDVVGFDIERHVYGEHRYPAQLVVQDVLTLHGKQFRNAALIVASPPCQFFSYCAMPWSKAKALAAAVRADPARLEKELALFDACFRIQREACEAAGRHIPLIVENVRGAIPWVGRSRWNFGSFHLWGDVPALMPMRVGGYKSKGLNWSDRTKRGQDFTRHAGLFAMEGVKVPSEQGRRTDKGNGARFTSRDCGVEGMWKTANTDEGRGIKHQASGAAWFDGGPAAFGSGTSARKMASAMIAKIPLPLSRHVAQVFHPSAIPGGWQCDCSPATAEAASAHPSPCAGRILSDGIPGESGLVRLARPPALTEDGTTVGPQVAARTRFSSSRDAAGHACGDLPAVAVES